LKITILGFGELIDGGWTNPQWMAHTLSKYGYDISYFNPPAYRALKISDIIRIKNRLKPRINKVNFSTFNVYFPFNNIFSFIVHRALIKECNESDLIMIFQPRWLKVVNKKILKNKRIMYFKTDDYVSIANDKEAAQYLEDKMVSISSSVCVTSKSLITKANNAVYLQNCIPSSLISNKRFITPKNSYQQKNRVLKLCYVGAVSDDKVDVRMLISFINRSNNLEFNFAGKIYSKEFSEFIACTTNEKIKYHGVLDFDEAQLLIINCDLGILPFLINDYTYGMFSMKFYEYISAGLPVLTTNIRMLDDLSNFQDYFTVADIFSEDIAVKAATRIKNNSEVARSLLKNCTYDARIEKMIQKNLIPRLAIK
jgi:glycosyltransferase involved in cell wall biosynthesis